MLLTPQTELYTKNGILRVSKIYKNTILLNSDGLEMPVISNNAIDKHQFFKIMLKNGTQLLLGKGTLIRTVKGLKKVEDLTDTDIVIHKFARMEMLTKNQKVDWEMSYLPGTVPIKVPNEMSSNFALWLGIVAGRGRYHEENGNIIVSLKESPMGKVYNELTFKLFRLIPRVYPDHRTGYMQHFFYSRHLIRFLKSSIGVSSGLKKVPQQIMEGSNEEQLSFVKGLSLEGYLENGNLNVYSGVSKRLVDFTTMVLRNAGYTLYCHSKKSSTGQNEAFYVKIMASCEWAEPFIPLEIDKTDYAQSSGYLVHLTPEMLKTKIPVNHPNYSAIRNLRQRKAETCFNSTLDDLGIQYPKDEYCVAVKEINTIESDGFEIEIEGGICYQNASIG